MRIKNKMSVASKFFIERNILLTSSIIRNVNYLSSKKKIPGPGVHMVHVSYVRKENINPRIDYVI